MRTEGLQRPTSGKRVFETAPEHKTAWFFEGARHNNLKEFGFETQLLNYLEQNRSRKH
jgi:hypothetical protein